MDMEGWEANGTDLELGDSTIDWGITRCDEMASDGSYSVKLYLNNLNDAGKIWIERPFAVKPDRDYKVNVEYAFASADYGEFNLFKIITGVFQRKPLTGKELISACRDRTGIGDIPGRGYKWLNKEYEFTVRSGEDGVLYLVIGIWGTWETSRTYYLDAVRVTLTEL
jgi:hypothetical protein